MDRRSSPRNSPTSPWLPRSSSQFWDNPLLLFSVLSRLVGRAVSLVSSLLLVTVPGQPATYAYPLPLIMSEKQTPSSGKSQGRMTPSTTFATPIRPEYQNTELPPRHVSAPTSSLDPRIWGWKTWLAVISVTAVVIASVVVGGILGVRIDPYPDYYRMNYRLQDTCKSATLPITMVEQA